MGFATETRLVSVAKLVKKASAQCGGLGVSTVAGACVRGYRKKLSKRDGRDVVMSRTCRNRIRQETRCHQGLAGTVVKCSMPPLCRRPAAASRPTTQQRGDHQEVVG